MNKKHFFDLAFDSRFTDEQVTILVDEYQINDLDSFPDEVKKTLSIAIAEGKLDWKIVEKYFCGEGAFDEKCDFTLLLSIM